MQKPSPSTSPLDCPLALGIIPARYASTRFPGKPLALISGKSLLQHTYDNAAASPALAAVIIATDDERIAAHARSFGATVIMTDTSHPTGSDRLAEVIQKDSTYTHLPYVVNIQGDEPVLPSNAIAAVVSALHHAEDAAMATAITPITSWDDAIDPSIVKCVVNKKGSALYFSRSPIPGNKENSSLQKLSTPMYRHIGLYAFRRSSLLEYATLPPTPMQLAEDLEQLKALEWGMSIQTAVIPHGGIGVDTPKDITKVEKFLCKLSSSL